jgi:hypothetical protein
MAGAGYRLFATGDVLTAAQVNTYLQQQTVMVFADSSARTTALSGVIAEGMVSYLQSDDTVYVYNGSAWVSIANSGDITSVGVTAPITGGGTSGAVTIGVDTATTAAVGVVQLTNSTSSTSTTTAAVPANVKTAYDLAAAAIPKTLTTTTGDIIYASGANTPSRLGIGSTSQILTVSGGLPVWSTPSASASGLTLIVKSSFSAVSSHSLNSCFSATYDFYEIKIAFTATTGTGIEFAYKLRSGGTDNSADYYGCQVYGYNPSNVGVQNNGGLSSAQFSAGSSGAATGQYTGIQSTIANPYKSQVTTLMSQGTYGTALIFNMNNAGYHNNASSFDGLTLTGSSGTMTGTIYVYGWAV